MINFINHNNEIPYRVLLEAYKKALKAKQKNIEALTISSYNPTLNEVDSRYVNLKIIDNNKFIFFTNYNSPKSIAFDLHKQISALFFWESINIQIRMKAHIYKTSMDFNRNYFKNRSSEKNALAISSFQSRQISSYERVLENYKTAKNNEDLTKCPEYWGGYYFIPYLIEFWTGNDYRINERNLYEKNKDSWQHSIIQP